MGEAEDPEGEGGGDLTGGGVIGGTVHVVSGDGIIKHTALYSGLIVQIIIMCSWFLRCMCWCVCK